MNKNELIKHAKPIIELFIVGKEFKVSELYDPVVWMSYPAKTTQEIASEFSSLLVDELKEMVQVKKIDTDLLKQVYVKIGNKTIKPQENVFPNEPVTIKRNERGNA